jgi:L-asparaginase II
MPATPALDDPPGPGYAPVVEVTRGGIVESLHYGALAVVEAGGGMLAWIGDTELRPFLRSSAKPIQAIPLVESGAAAALGLDAADLAVVCGSHTGTPEHVAQVESLQRRAGLDMAMLRCGVHAPYDSESAQRLRQLGLQPTPNHNNCSGKHSGMLALAQHLGAPLEGYLEPEHVVQQKILRTLAELAGVEIGQVTVGVDGCSAPTFALPLRAAALAFARLMRGAPGARGEACRTIVQAMMRHPEMVAGPRSFDTPLIRAGGGRWISKGGAEGFLAIGIAPDAMGRGSPAVGLAAKVADGDAARRALTLLALAVLGDLGLLRELPAELAEFGARPVRSWQGRQVGELRPCYRLARGGRQG